MKIWSKIGLGPSWGPSLEKLEKWSKKTYLFEASWGPSWRVLGPKMAPVTAKLAGLGIKRRQNGQKVDPKIDMFLDAS